MSELGCVYVCVFGGWRGGAPWPRLTADWILLPQYSLHPVLVCAVGRGEDHSEMR